MILAGVRAEATFHQVSGNVTPIRSAIDIDSAALLDRLPPAGATSVDDPIRSLDALMLNIDSAGLEPAQ